MSKYVNVGIHWIDHHLKIKHKIQVYYFNVCLYLASRFIFMFNMDFIFSIDLFYKSILRYERQLTSNIDDGDKLKLFRQVFWNWTRRNKRLHINFFEMVIFDSFFSVHMIQFYLTMTFLEYYQKLLTNLIWPSFATQDKCLTFQYNSTCMISFSFISKIEVYCFYIIIWIWIKITPEKTFTPERMFVCVQSFDFVHDLCPNPMSQNWVFTCPWSCLNSSTESESNRW